MVGDIWTTRKNGIEITEYSGRRRNVPKIIIIILWSTQTLGLWLRLECSLDSLSIDSAHVIYVSEGYDVAYNRRTASQPSYVVLRWKCGRYNMIM